MASKDGKSRREIETRVYESGRDSYSRETRVKITVKIVLKVMMWRAEM